MVRVLFLGLAQLILWGTSFYSIGVFGPYFEAELHFSKELVYGGFSAALVAMALVSSAVGTLVHRLGGFRVMVAGAILAAWSTAALTVVESVPAYYAVWALRGVAMRLTLYDAAFATLAQIDDKNSARAMSQITLLGGLASVVFWPLGQALVSQIGLQKTIFVYAAVSLASIAFLLPLRVPRVSLGNEGAKVLSREDGQTGDGPPAAIALFVVIVTLSVFLLAGLSSQLIPILVELGNAPETAAWAAACMGFGQVTARIVQVALGHRIDATRLNLISATLMFIGFSLAFVAEVLPAAGFAFAFFYGAGHGLTAIVRGTLPLLLFDKNSYARRVGKLIVPGFFFSAAAPAIYAYLMDDFGEGATLAASWVLGAVMLAAAVMLRRLLRA